MSPLFAGKRDPDGGAAPLYRRYLPLELSNVHSRGSHSSGYHPTPKRQDCTSSCRACSYLVVVSTAPRLFAERHAMSSVLHHTYDRRVRLLRFILIFSFAIPRSVPSTMILRCFVRFKARSCVVEIADSFARRQTAERACVCLLGLFVGILCKTSVRVSRRRVGSVGTSFFFVVSGTYDM